MSTVPPTSQGAESGLSAVAEAYAPAGEQRTAQCISVQTDVGPRCAVQNLKPAQQQKARQQARGARGQGRSLRSEAPEMAQLLRRKPGDQRRFPYPTQSAQSSL